MNSIPRSEHPRPDFMRPDWLNLNGTWEFAFDDDDSGLKSRWYLPNNHFPLRITVPFCYQSALSGINDNSRHEVVWYRRLFTVPDSMRNKRILLKFGAVDYCCDVYINGSNVGSHCGGYTPFALDITPHISDGDNDLCVRVVDKPDCTQPRGKQNWLDKAFICWYTPISGIWQTVYIEAAGDNYLTGAHIKPDLDAGAAIVRLTLACEPSNPIDAEITVTLDGKCVSRQVKTMMQRSEQIMIDMVSGHDVWGFKTWSPSSPTLYDVNIKLSGGDEVSTYFGMRSIEVKDGWVLLNKSPLYQRLVLDQGYWPESLMTPPSDDAIKADIEWTKRLGYNGARKHQKLEDPRYYYWADKLGLLVWGEVPSAYEFTNEMISNVSDTLYGFIERDFNHPSIITWVPLNESWGVDRIYRDSRMQYFADMLYYQAKAMDGTRLVSTNDGWEYTRTDICGVHDYSAYGDDLSKHMESRDRIEKYACAGHMTYAKGAKPTGQEALLLTEYGGIAFEEGNDESWGYHDKVANDEAFFERYRSLNEAILSIPYCQGYCYTQLTDVQQEVNGLLTADRKPKIDTERFAELTRNPLGR